MRFKRCGESIEGVHMQLLIVIAEMRVRIHVGVRGSIPAEGSCNKTLSAKIITGGCNCQIFPLNFTYYIETRGRGLSFFFFFFLLLLPSCADEDSVRLGYHASERKQLTAQWRGVTYQKNWIRSPKPCQWTFLSRQFRFISTDTSLNIKWRCIWYWSSVVLLWLTKKGVLKMSVLFSAF